MQISRLVEGLVLALAIVTTADVALAGGGHRHHGGTRVVVGVGFGYGFGYPFGYRWGYPWGYGYPYPYYYPYYPAYYPAPQQPTVYIEQPQTQPTQQTQQPTGYWYYCPTTQAYYPYVRECTVSWQRVAPQPAN